MCIRDSLYIVQGFWLRRALGVFELQRGFAGVGSPIGCVVVQLCRGAVCVARECWQLWQQQFDSCRGVVWDLGSERPCAYSKQCSFEHQLDCRKQRWLSCWKRTEWCAESHRFCCRAARQRECCSELRRAERELCWCEQCREQRGHERECCLLYTSPSPRD